MKRNVKGIASATYKRADGGTETYWYAWRGGPRLIGRYGSPDFWASYDRALKTRKVDDARGTTFDKLITEFKQSPKFKNLSDRSRKDYAHYLDMIAAKFGKARLHAFEDKRMRGEIQAWRDEFADTPRKADYIMQVMTRLLSFGKDRGKLKVNVCDKAGRLYDSDRSEKVWTDSDLAELRKIAAPDVWAAVTLALGTGQREGDLLGLTWAAFDGEKITFRQGKSRRHNKEGRLVVIPCTVEVKALLAELRAANEARQVPAATILTSSHGRPWKLDGFKRAWQRARIKIDENRAKAAKANGSEFLPLDLHFHDLRGTTVTRLAIAGCTVPEIASITGHSLKSVQTILDKYLCRDERLAQSAIRKLEVANESETKTAKDLQRA